MSQKQIRSVRLKKLLLELVKALGNDVIVCRERGIARSTFYRLKKTFPEQGEAGLIRKKPFVKSHPRQLSPEVIEKILHLRRVYHLGLERIIWYIERYHIINTFCSSVYRTLLRNGMSRLPKNTKIRTKHTRRYSKQIPGHHIQVDARFLA